jgi:hypothetical protein
MKDLYPENGLPVNISNSFFNYDVDRFALYGPGFPEWVRHNASMLKIEYQNNGWSNVKNPNGTDFYWGEFDANGHGPWVAVLANKNLETNQCGNVGKQSPIDVRDSGATCLEHHQIRTRVSSRICTCCHYVFLAFLVRPNARIVMWLLSREGMLSLAAT